MRFTVLFVTSTQRFYEIVPYSAKIHLPRAHKFLCSLEESDKCILIVGAMVTDLAGHQDLVKVLHILADDPKTELRNHPNLLSSNFVAAGTIQQGKIGADGWESRSYGIITPKAWKEDILKALGIVFE